jgi:hypothetical protein
MRFVKPECYSQGSVYETKFAQTFRIGKEDSYGGNWA